MRFIATTLLITLLAILTKGENWFCYGRCNATSSHYGVEKTKCVVCNTPKECENPQKISCTLELVKYTIANISRVFINAKILIEPSTHLACFAIHAHNLNKKEIDIRGCMYYQPKATKVPILSYTFDFIPMYAAKKYKEVIVKSFFKKVTITKNFETYNRTLWNITHFSDYSCYQCDASYCNRQIPPNRGGKILFQRPSRGLKEWQCIIYQEKNKNQFNDRCKKDGTIFIYKGIQWTPVEDNITCGIAWDWPNTVVAPPIVDPADWGYSPA